MTSHDAHDLAVTHELPKSAGVHWAVSFLFVGGALLTIMQGFFVAGLASPYGRVWPASATATVQLPASHLK